MHDTDSVRCDIASDNAAIIPRLLKYTAVLDGVCYALPVLLLVDKIRTYGERGEKVVRKRECDAEDIFFLLGLLIDAEETVPDDLREMILPVHSLARFWDALPASERLLYEDFFAQVGI